MSNGPAYVRLATDSGKNPYKTDGMNSYTDNVKATYEFSTDVPDPAISETSVLIKAQPINPSQVWHCFAIQNRKAIALEDASSISIWIKVLSGEGEFQFHVDEAGTNRVVWSDKPRAESFPTWKADDEKNGWKKLVFPLEGGRGMFNANGALLMPIERVYILLYLSGTKGAEFLVGPIMYE